MIPLQATLLLTGFALIVLMIRTLVWSIVRAVLRKAPSHSARIIGFVAAHVPTDWGAGRDPERFAFLRRRLRPAVFTGLPLTLILVGAAYVAALLGGLAGEVVEAEEMLQIDRAINVALTPWRSSQLVTVFLWITGVGAGPALGAVAMTATAFLWAGQRQRMIAPLWVALAGAQATTWIGKFAIDRHRPEFIQGITAASPSFPSAHAAGSMAIYGFLAYAITRGNGGLKAQFEVTYWSGVLIALIGFSRVFLSVHYMSDIVGGWLVGVFWLLVAFAVAEAHRHFGRVGTEDTTALHR